MGMSADPAHKGHLKVAETLQDLGYERVVWMITPQNPAKKLGGTPYIHRLELARLLVGRRTWLEISDAEGWMHLFGEDLRTHTMLKHMRELYPTVPFTFVMGSDNWGFFHTWGRYKDILDYCGVLIVPRPGAGKLDTTPAALAMADRRAPKGTGVVPQGQWAILDDFPGGSASATQIRRALADGQPTKWLSDGQMAYVQKYNLYNIKS